MQELKIVTPIQKAKCSYPNPALRKERNIKINYFLGIYVVNNNVL